MSAISLPFIVRPLRPLLALLILALVFGTLDILDSLLFWGMSMDVPPMHIFQGIASGLLGSVAFQGGAPTALLGGLLQYSAFFCLLGLYYLADRKFTFIARQPWLYGPLYGFLSYLVIRFGILPLSAYHIVPGFYPAISINSAMAQILFVGLPAVLMVHGLNSNEKTMHRAEQEVGHASPSH
jgi:hypothetical protein